MNASWRIPNLSPAVVFTLCVLTGCGGHSVVRVEEDGPGSVPIGDQTPDAVPRAEPKSRYGNPESYVVNGRRYYTLSSSSGFVERGVASWYGRKFHGRRTSSGEPYNMYAMTAAHKNLPLPTYVHVTNLKNGASAVVRVNDRGPFHENRVIDLSYAAAKRLDIVREGTGLVEVRALNPGRRLARSLKSVQPPSRPAAIPELFIQVGAFVHRQNAEMLRNQLSEHDLGNIWVIPTVNEEQTVYRVRIGPLASVSIADQTTQRLGLLGMRDYSVVID